MNTEPTLEQLRAAHCAEAVDRVPGQPDVTAYKRRLRLRQARWRERNGLPIGHQRTRSGGARPIGSRIELGYAQQSESNFLNDRIRAAVRARLDRRQRHEMIDATRLCSDLLSSMPMCFNLFGDLHEDPDAADRAVHEWWSDTPGRVDEVAFEWSPGRLDAQYLGNRSAFDVAFLLSTDGARGIIGVETKYHEHPARESKPISDDRLKRYVEVTERSGAFIPGAADRLIDTELRQIWLDHLLVLSMLQHPSGDWQWGRFVLVYPDENVSFRDAAGRYRELLADTSTFATATVEELLQADDALPIETVTAFRDRYLA